MVHYFEAGLCLASTFLSFKSMTAPNAPHKKRGTSKAKVSEIILGAFLPLWKAIAITSGLSQAYFFLKKPEVVIPWKTHFMVGIASIILGSSLRLWCFRTLGNFFTFTLSVADNHRVIDSAPYSIVRHPSYIGALLSMYGACFCNIGPLNIWCTQLPTRTLYLSFGDFSFTPTTQDAVRGALTVVSTLLWLVYFRAFVTRIPEEEAMLKKELGNEYAEYQTRVPFRMIPYIW